MGATPDIASDVYALGVVLYEALTGQLPHGSIDDPDYLVRKLTRAADPLASHGASVPVHVARTIDGMLLREPSRRLPSCADVLRCLRAEEDEALRVLPRLGHSVVPDVVGALLSDQNVCVVGGRGSGRSRTVDDTLSELLAESKSVVRLVPHTEPFMSLEPLLGEVEAQVGATLDEVVQRVAIDVRALLPTLCLVVDDLESMDRWTQRVLLDCAELGGLLCTSLRVPERGSFRVVTLRNLTSEDLVQLFAGPARVFHLPEDAAEALYQRTGGVPRAVSDEMDAWLRAGLVQRTGDRFTIQREGIDRLQASGPLAVVPYSKRVDDGLSSAQRELIEWLGLIRNPRGIGFLATLTQRAEWRVEADLQTLAERGLIRREADGWPALTHAAIVHTGHWTPAEQLRAHHAIGTALLTGEPGRLHHLLRAGEVDAVLLCEEAVSTARHEARSGSLRRAISSLGETLRVVRAEGAAPASCLRLLEEWLLVSVREGTPLALDRMVYELERSELPSARQLDMLARAALATLNATGPLALGQLEQIPPFEDMMLELTRQDLRALAARRCTPEVHARTVADASAWAERFDDAEVTATRMSWLARLRYREGDFTRAARLFFEAAELEPWPVTAIDLRFLSAASLMETFAHAEAAERAREARDAAARLRQPAREAWAEWALRAARYRAGLPVELEAEWVDAVRLLGVSELTALVCFTEAALAFRGNELARACELCGEARRLWERVGKEWTAMMAQSLACACGATASEEERDGVANRARACSVPGLGVQALALLTRGGWKLPADWRASAWELARAVDERHWNERMDVLSVNESLATLSLAG
jgi:hypothetical protein